MGNINENRDDSWNHQLKRLRGICATHWWNNKTTEHFVQRVPSTVCVSWVELGFP